MASKLVRIEAPITGYFDEQVNVGDQVMVMTTSCGVPSLNKGTYLGYVEGNSWGRKTQRAQVAVESKRYVLLKPDGTEFNWNKDYHRDTYKKLEKTLTRKEIPYTRISTLNLNRIATLKD